MISRDANRTRARSSILPRRGRALRSALLVLACASFLSFAKGARADEVEECATAAELAQSLRDGGRLVEARASLLRCAQTSCPRLVREDCATWLPELDARMPSIVLKALGERGDDLADVRVTRDGEPLVDRLDGTALPIDPGETTLSFVADGYEPIAKTIIVAEGQRGRLVVVQLKRAGALPPPSSDSPTSKSSSGPGVLPWVFAGVGVAGLATFGVLQGLAHGEVADLDQGCGQTQTCGDEQLDPIRTKFVLSAVGLGVGLAGLGAAALTFALGGGSDDAASVPKLRASVRADGPRLEVSVPLGL